MKTKGAIGAVACGILLAACGGDGSTGSHAEHEHVAGADDHDEHGSGPSVLGEAGDPAEADRTIEIVASDAPFRFEPEEISVRVGETIVFELFNEGAVEHEFVLAEEPTQEATEGHEHSGEPNATERAEPGQSKQVAWRFTEPGDYVYECHVDAHHLTGMRGTITVSE